MRKRSIVFLVVCILLSTLLACGGASTTALSTAEEVDTLGAVQAGTASTGTDAVAGSAVEAALVEAATTSSAAEAAQDHAAAQAEVSSSTESTSIVLEGDLITVTGTGATVDGSVVTITSAGTYLISGSLDDGQIIVNTQDGGAVRLTLDGASINSSTGPAIHIISAQETVLGLADDSESSVSDGDSRAAEGTEDDPNAAIYSMADLTITGKGSLCVEGNYSDGIASKDGLLIAGSTLLVESADDGIRGKDYLIVQGGTITVDAQGDGLKADNDVDAAQGYISIEAGAIQVTSGGDAITAQTSVTIADGELTLSSGGGSNSRIDASASAKGIKALVSVTIDGGVFTIDSADDALHSNGSLIVNGGTFLISTGDDALHADSSLEVNGGDITIRESYEGLESAIVTIDAGNVHITASDDGINVAGGVDSSGMTLGPGLGGPGGRGQDTFASSGSYYLTINGGYVAVDADGDGIDVNGTVEMTDGVVLVSGPTENMNGALDYDGSFTMTGGFLVAAGSAGMAQAPDQSSSQASLLLNFSSTLQAGTLIHIETSTGEEILTFSGAKEYQSIAFSSPALTEGTTYVVYYGGTSTGVATDGLYQGGSYTGGTQYTSFVASAAVTRLGGNFR